MSSKTQTGGLKEFEYTGREKFLEEDTNSTKEFKKELKKFYNETEKQKQERKNKIERDKVIEEARIQNAILECQEADRLMAQEQYEEQHPILTFFKKHFGRKNQK